MAPKIKITKEDIINAALDIVRESGAHALNARMIAEVLECSTQPIFSNFVTMDELRMAVVSKAESLCQQYMKREVERGEYPEYKANGMAYIRFAKEEKELFKLLYMCDRTGEVVPTATELTDKMEVLVHCNTGLDGNEAKLFHLEIWAFVHGIATMFATGYLNLEWELVSSMITDCYQGLKKQHEKEQ